MFIVSYRWQWQCVATYGQQCLYTTAEVHLLGKILNDGLDVITQQQQ